MGLPCVELPRRSTAVVWSCPGLFPKRPSSVLGVPTGARCAWRRSFATITRTLAVRSISQTAALLITQPASIWRVIETGQIAESLGLCSMGSFLCNLLHLRKKIKKPNVWGLDAKEVLRGTAGQMRRGSTIWMHKQYCELLHALVERCKFASACGRALVTASTTLVSESLPVTLRTVPEQLGDFV